MKKGLSLKTVLIISFILIATMPAAVIGIIGFNILSSMEKEIAGRNYIIAKTMAREVDRFLSEPVRLLAQIRDATEVRYLVQSYEIDTYFDSVLSNYPFFDMLVILDNNGSVTHMAPFNDDFLNMDMSKRFFHLDNRDTQKPLWSSTYISIHTGQITLAVGYPLKKGMVVGYLNLSKLSDIVRKTVLGSGGYAAIVNKDGVIIAHKENSVVARQVNIRNIYAVEMGLKGKEGTFSYFLDGKKWLGSVSIVPETKWLVVLFQTAKDAYIPIIRVKNFIITGLFTVGIIAVVIILAILKKTMPPLSHLLENTKKLARGDYNYLSQPESYEEINELAENFKTMARAIQTREKELKASEEKYRLLVENASDAIFITQDGFIKFHNPKTLEMIGHSAKKISETQFIYFIHPEDRKVVMERYKQRLEGKKIKGSYSFRFIHKSGKVLWGQLNAALTTWEGRPATINFLRDITREKRLEEKLVQAQRLESIGTLAGGIAHNFNNILMGIQGRISLILIEMSHCHPYYEHLKIVEDLVNSAAGLTRQLLGLARGGKYEVKPANINDIIKKQSKLFGRTKKEIVIHENLGENLYAVEVDRSQIEQVLLNLYVNSWQAMPKGGHIYVRTANIILDKDDVNHFKGKPGKYIKISVTDTGEGMDSETLKKIFDPFFTTKQRDRGTGLGLASAMGIIKNHGGYIDVYSEKGEGTTFNIYLPAIKADIHTKTTHSKDLTMGSGTILLVDDEKMVAEVGSQMVERLGYNVFTANSGKDAISFFRDNHGKVDLVILDMIMPEMGGKEVFDALRQIHSRVKIILSSGYSLNGRANDIMNQGCKGFIQKPFSMQELADKIKEVLNNGK